MLLLKLGWRLGKIEDSSESFQVSGSSSTSAIIGGAVGGVSRESSSGASSDTIKGHLKQSRPPRSMTPRTERIQDERPMTVAEGSIVASPSDHSSLPPLEPWDRTEDQFMDPVASDVSHSSTQGSYHLHSHQHQTVNMDQRSVNVDQRSVQVNNLDPVVVAEACQAVSRAQPEVSQVQAQAEVQRVQALAQIEVTKTQARSESNKLMP